MSSTKDSIDRDIALCKESLGQSLVVRFESGAIQVVRPTKAFDKRWRDLALYLADNAPHNYSINNDGGKQGKEVRGGSSK